MAKTSNKITRRRKIRHRIRRKIEGNAESPRLAVFRSNSEIYAQVIDDISGKTVAAASSLEKEFVKEKGNKIDMAKKIGKLVAERTSKAGVNAVKFDRGGYLYHGRVKALAEAAREAGLKF
ncbi:MAG TPA: 50S ribosomal protein L18 [Bacteroidia bacterium]|nr:50S ribosomal protein L18 [Bacteroidia bacterium]